MDKLTFFILLFYSVSSFALDCHPKVDARLPQYIIGYGSLIDDASKNRTDPLAGKSIPVLVKGCQRIWAGHGDLPGLNATFLSAVKNNKASLNGVVYPLDNPQAIVSYDKREGIYCRRLINATNLVLLSQSTLPTHKQVWIYILKAEANQSPTQEFPIVQSYVDIFLRGCIQVEEKYKIKDFARNCIINTQNWPGYWINDRIFPRRPSLYEPFAVQIDALLKSTIPEKFKYISFEKAESYRLEQVNHQ